MNQISQTSRRSSVGSDSFVESQTQIFKIIHEIREREEKEAEPKSNAFNQSKRRTSISRRNINPFGIIQLGPKAVSYFVYFSSVHVVVYEFFLFPMLWHFRLGFGSQISDLLEYQCLIHNLRFFFSINNLNYFIDKPTI
jgi:hypothetical protein